MIPPEVVQRLKNSSEFLIFQRHLEDEIASLDNCSTIPEDSDFGAESRGRKRAVEIMRNALAPFTPKTQGEEVPDVVKQAISKHALDEG